ncbi:hypothetical protein IW261DRAFT_194083 [Armillaria novae-zelandiae]|uniref:Uncharacterized protein n=1 Tax=Armillaria novae-zelandiae TaxID=153914 RepID=A0AA39P7A3_9AGAR|nr:hypothetical protein IW261DRAFT_194083 [Armillaria novae-zelandiae]
MKLCNRAGSLRLHYVWYAMKLAYLRRLFTCVTFTITISAIPISDSTPHSRSDVSSIKTTMTVQLDGGPKNENITQMNSDLTGSRWYYIAENWKLKDSDDNQTSRAILITDTNGRPLRQGEINFFEEVSSKALLKWIMKMEGTAGGPFSPTSLRIPRNPPCPK